MSLLRLLGASPQLDTPLPSTTTSLAKIPPTTGRQPGQVGGVSEILHHSVSEMPAGAQSEAQQTSRRFVLLRVDGSESCGGALHTNSEASRY